MSLELKNVRKSYSLPDGSRLPILGISSFELKSGEQVALIGSSGGGKTTLLNSIAGITTIDEGAIRVDGTDITKLNEPTRDRFRAQRIGIVFQTFHLLPAFTALENVLLGMSFSGRANRTRAKELLDRVGLGQRLNHRPSMLSVGEQQRVAVARSLANSPKLMLADEPTASVDQANQSKILELIRDACRENKISLLLVTHAPEVAAAFDRVETLSHFNQPAQNPSVGAST